LFFCFPAAAVVTFLRMEFRFDANEWSRLALEERVHRCKLMAQEARSLAESASSADLQEAYSKIAAEWLELGTEIESSAR
jgi:hypothetical protein